MYFSFSTRSTTFYYKLLRGGFEVGERKLAMGWQSSLHIFATSHIMNRTQYLS